MTRRTDIIRWVVDWMLAHEPSITEELALRCEREARAEWGGQQIGYVARTCATDNPNGAQGLPEPVLRQLVSEYRNGRPVSQIAQSSGVSRATLYRALKRL